MVLSHGSLDSKMSHTRRMVTYRLEQIYPIAIGIAVAVSFLKYAPVIDLWGQEKHIHLETTYTAAAGLFAVIAGFLASFYGSIQSIADTRLARISNSKVFKDFLWRIKESTIAGFTLSVFSIPLMVASPTDFDGLFWRVLVAVWLGASIYAIATFVRVGRLLFFVFEIKPPQDDGAY
jgi:hypothetical protein